MKTYNNLDELKKDIKGNTLAVAEDITINFDVYMPGLKIEIDGDILTNCDIKCEYIKAYNIFTSGNLEAYIIDAHNVISIGSINALNFSKRGL